jgi:hypothetical protein
MSKPLRCHPITAAGLTSTKVVEAGLGRVAPRKNGQSRAAVRGALRLESDNLMSPGEELKLQRRAAANTEREEGNESRQHRNHAPRRYGGGAGKSSFILDGSQLSKDIGGFGKATSEPHAVCFVHCRFVSETNRSVSIHSGLEVILDTPVPFFPESAHNLD